MAFPPDEELLADVDDPDQAAAVLASAGDLYRNHLIAARIVDGWAKENADQAARAKAFEELAEIDESSAAWLAGYAQAFREIARHLRWGDFIPGPDTFHDDYLRSATRP